MPICQDRKPPTVVDNSSNLILIRGIYGEALAKAEGCAANSYGFLITLNTSDLNCLFSCSSVTRYKPAGRNLPSGMARETLPIPSLRGTTNV